MNYGKLFIALSVFATFLPLSCASRETAAPAPGVQAPAPEKPAAPVKTGWEAEWEKILTTGRREGVVVLYSTLGSDVRNAFTEAFPKATGIKLDMVTGRSSQAAAKITTERNVGIYLVDVFSAGPNNMFDFIDKGFLQPLKPQLILPEVKDPNVWFQKKLPFMDKKGDSVFAFRANPGGYTLMINTNQVKESEVTSFWDLLDSRWKGKIVMDDVTSTGSGQKWVMMGLLYWGLNWDYMKQIARQEPYMGRDERQMIDWIARGKFPIGMAPSSDVAAEFRKAGAPIKMIALKEEIQYISTGGGNVALMKNAPHPNAARVFINWLLTREAQTLYSRARQDNSARIDVPTDHMPDWRVRDPKAEYLQIDMEEIQTSPKWLETADKVKEIFGPLLR